MIFRLKIMRSTRIMCKELFAPEATGVLLARTAASSWVVGILKSWSTPCPLSDWGAKNREASFYYLQTQSLTSETLLDEEKVIQLLPTYPATVHRHASARPTYWNRHSDARANKPCAECVKTVKPTAGVTTISVMGIVTLSEICDYTWL